MIGDEGLAIYNTFGLSTETSTYDAVIKKFENYCKEKKNVLFERHKFFKTLRIDGQTIDNYVTVLRTIGANCEFGDQLESLIRDQIVLHLTDQGLQERILRESELDLLKVVEFVKASETTKEQVRLIQEKSVEIHGVRRSNNKSNYSTVNDEGRKLNNNLSPKYGNHSGVNSNNDAVYYQCRKCGNKHRANNCPAYGKYCSLCNKPNHFAVACFKNKKNISLIKQNKYDSEQDYTDTLIDSCELDESSRKICKINLLQWSQNLIINNKELEFKLDTGAEINVMPISCLFKLGVNTDNICNNRQIILEVFGGNRLRSSGVIKLNCSANKTRNCQLSFVVVDDANNNKIKPLLGLDGCVKLNLIKRINDLTVDNQKKMEILKRNEDIFNGTGLIKNYECHIKVDKSVAPVIRPPRRVPLAIRDRLQEKLNLLERGKIIEKIDGPVTWLSNLVVIEKSDGGLRVCLDPTDLNKAIIKTPALIPTLQEVTSQLTGKFWFSLLDLKEGFYNIKLDKESSNYCAFSTPFGCYKFLRLPFGVSNAPEEFQRVNTSIFSDIPGLIIYFDDILIATETEKEHDEVLNKVLERARSSNLKFNPNKFQYKTNKVTFLGFEFDKNGMKIDPQRIKAIESLENPCNKKELQRILGMLNYIRNFIPNFADLTSNLRTLLKCNVEFTWTEAHSMLLKKIKELITKIPVLTHFDTSKEITIECDASKDAIGCCLMQEGQPISYASRSLSPTEKNFAQIEKELLSILFATSKFHLYIYGRKTFVRTDHKPLVSLIKKNVGEIPSPRLQRMILKLIKYDLELRYVPGKELYIADLLSRGCENEENISSEEDWISEIVHEVASNNYQLQVTSRRKKILEEETAKDKTLQHLVKYYMNGWPANSKDVPEEIKIYYKFKDEIYVSGNLVFVGRKLSVPISLRKEMLEKLHSPHLGVSKTQARARQIFYWPQMNSDIEEYVLKCKICETFRNKNIKEPLMPYPVPSRPYQRVGMDFFQLGNYSYLIIVDYLSAWFDVVKMPYKTASETIKTIKPIFATHGIPDEIVADNMPFSSFEFKQFCQGWEIKLTNTSPHYPQSNGMVEKAVGICKSLMRKCYKSGQDFNLVLMEYRNCPVTGLSESPAQLMMSRQLRTVLPTIEENLLPNVVRVKEDKELKQQKSKLYYDKTSQQKRGFKDGESVVHRRGRRWEPAQIIKSNNTPRSYIIRTEDGQTLVRNSVHLRKSGNPFSMNGDQNSYSTLGNNTTESNGSNTETQSVPAQLPQESSEITSETYNPALPQAMSRYGRRIIKPRRLVEE